MKSEDTNCLKAVILIMHDEAEQIKKAKAIKPNMHYWAELLRSCRGLTLILIEQEKGYPKMMGAKNEQE